MKKRNLFISILLYLPILLMGQNVLSVNDMEVDAYTNDIALSFNLENLTNEVGGLQFDLNQDIDLVSIFSAEGVGRADGFDVTYSIIQSGDLRVIMVNTAGDNISTGNDSVLVLHYDGSEVASGVVNFGFSNLIISDPDGNLLASSFEGGMLEIGDTASLSVSGGSGDAGDTVELLVTLSNEGNVGGLQFDLVDNPNLVTVDSVWTLDGAGNFSVQWNNVAGGTRVLLWDPNNGFIPSGDNNVVGLRAIIDNHAHAGDITVGFTNAVVSDEIGGSIWVAELGTGIVSVYPGYLEPPRNLVAETGFDGHVPLEWDPPASGGGGGGVESYFQCFEFCDSTTWDVSIDHAVDNGNGGWLRGEDGSEVPCGTGFNFCESDAVDGNAPVAIWTAAGIAVDSRLITPMIDLSGYTTATLNYWTAYIYTSYATMINEVQVSTDGGGAWETVYEDDPFTTGDNLVERSVDLSGYVGYSVLVAFRFLDDSYGEAWFVDDIEVSGNGRAGSSAMYAIDTPSEKATRFDLTGLWTPVNDNPVRDLQGYRIYRSLASGTGFEQIAANDPGVEEYDDTDVANGTMYYYAVSADYGELGESEFSNEASATPAEWVTLSLSDGAAISGFTDTVWVSLENASDVGNINITIDDAPDNLTAEDVVTTDRTTGYTAVFSDQTSGEVAIYFEQDGDPIAPGEGAICGIVYRAAATVFTPVSLTFSSAVAQNPDGTMYMVGSIPSTFLISVETQYCFMGSGFADPGSDGTITLSLSNTLPVYGFEIIISDNPDVLTGVSIEATERIPSSISIAGFESNGMYTISAVGFAGDAIEPGAGPIAHITFSVDSDAEVETVVDLNYASYEFWDFANNEILTNVTVGEFAVGTPEALFSFSGGMNHTFKIDLANSVEVYGVQVLIDDVPDWITVIDVQGTDRIPDGSSVNWSDVGGNLNILMFNGNLIPIDSGDGPIFEVTVQISSQAEGMVSLNYTQALASDSEGDPSAIYAFGVGGWLDIDALLNIEPEANLIIPDEFLLYQNYPNPFNPVTTIQYDLPNAGEVKVKILNILGQEVATLVNSYQPAGIYRVNWDGTDQFGSLVNSGVYLYQIRSNDFIDTKKMILIK